MPERFFAPETTERLAGKFFEKLLDRLRVEGLQFHIENPRDKSKVVIVIHNGYQMNQFLFSATNTDFQWARIG